MAHDQELSDPSTGDSPQLSTTVLASPDTNVQPRITLTPNDMHFLTILDRGVNSKVFLIQMKKSNKYYACKVLKKELIIQNDEIKTVETQKRIFLLGTEHKHPFMCKLFATFQTETRLYFLTGYIPGGNLMFHLQRGQLDSDRAQFYASEICLGLKYLHENGIIYRNLKLEHVLLDEDGHIKLIAFGICKTDMWHGSTTHTFCGSQEFMAPEVLLGNSYGRAVDWWSFGIIFYQMMFQQNPFRGDDEDDIYDAILTDDPLYPIHIPEATTSLLQKLLAREPELRLGSGPTDAQEIMSHPFFQGVDWDSVYQKSIPAPFVPTLQNEIDTSNFLEEFTSVSPILTPVGSVLTPAMQDEFRGFSYATSNI